MRTQLYFMAILAYGLALSQYDPFVAKKAFEDFFDAQNPNDAKAILLAVEPDLLNAPDSIKAEFNLNLGIAYGQLGKVDSSFMFLELGERLAKSSNAEMILAKIYNTKGLVFMGMGDLDKALDAYHAAMSIAEGKTEARFKDALRKVYGNCGGIYYQLKDFEKAAELTEKALNISIQQKDTSGMAYNHLRLALVYNDNENLDRSIENLNLANSFLQKLGDTTTLIYAENTTGKVYQKKGQLIEALRHYTRAVELSKLLQNMQEVADMQLSLANIHFEMGHLQMAEKLALEVSRLATDLNYPSPLKGAYNVLYEIALKRRQFEKALGYRNQFFVLSDSLHGIEIKERVAELETNYETAKKEAEIQRLALENDLKDANLARSRNAQMAIGIGSGLMVIFLTLFFTLRHKKQLAERESQELQIEALKKRLLDLNISPSEPQFNTEELNQKIRTPLSERELEVLKLTLEGKSNTEISDILFISISTVKFHLRNTYGKLGVNNRKEALDYVVKSS